MDSRDIISNLSDEVLCLILSFLPTKFAVRTSILSTRWSHLWASIPNLDFDDTLLSHQGIIHIETSQHFVNFVNRVLLLRDVSYIQKFSLMCGQYSNPSIFHTWICAAIKSNVQELSLYMNNYMDLPRMLFTCKTLVNLTLGFLVVPELPASVWLPSLKILSLHFVKFMNVNTTQKLFSGCPILEELIILSIKSDDEWVFNVTLPALKSLNINFQSSGKLMVDAPNFEYLRLSNYGSEDYLVNNLSSLSTAYIDVGQSIRGIVGERDFGDRIYKLLSRISNVKFLSLSSETLYSLSLANDSTLSTFRNVTHLELGVTGDSGWQLLPDFLKSSPNLEVLVFNMVGNMDFTSTKDWSPPLHLPYCLVSHLKEIKIKLFNGKYFEFAAVELFAGELESFEDGN